MNNENEWLLNPKTGRMVKKNSITHRRLINQGVFKRTQTDDNVLHIIQENDDVESIKKQLSTGLPDNMSIRRGHGRNRGRLVKGFRVGRPRRPKEYQYNPTDDEVNPTDSESDF